MLGDTKLPKPINAENEINKCFENCVIFNIRIIDNHHTNKNVEQACIPLHVNDMKISTQYIQIIQLTVSVESKQF